MFQPIPAWMSSDGKETFTDYMKFLRYELFLILSKAGENEFIARKIALEMNPETLKSLVDILEVLEEEMESPSTFKVVTVEKN